MAELVYVDNSNVFIEGKRARAVEVGLALNIVDAMRNGILDHSYTLISGAFMISSWVMKRGLLSGACFLEVDHHPTTRCGPPPNEPGLKLWLRIAILPTRKKRLIRVLSPQ